MDRALDYGSKGWGFESLWARHSFLRFHMSPSRFPMACALVVLLAACGGPGASRADTDVADIVDVAPPTDALPLADEGPLDAPVQDASGDLDAPADTTNPTGDTGLSDVEPTLDVLPLDGIQDVADDVRDGSIEDDVRDVAPDSPQDGFEETACDVPDPRDATDDAAPAGLLGASCRDAADCADDLWCVPGIWGAAFGVCTRRCDLDQPVQCEVGTWCTRIDPVSQMAYCLVPCDLDRPCPTPLSCGNPTSPPLPPEPVCFPWPACDPLTNAGCGSALQCRLREGEPSCGAVGVLRELDPCRVDADACGPRLACAELPGLVCGDPDACTLTSGCGCCFPICDEDGSCVQTGWDACLRGHPEASFGLCGFAG